MLSDLQKKKLTRVFHVFDIDKNGFVEKSDYQAIIDNLASVRGYAQGSEGYQGLYTKQMMVWEGLASKADKSHSGKVNLDEWIGFHDELMSVEGMYDIMVNGAVDMMFDVLDLNGDGKVSSDEYRAFLKAYRVDVGPWTDTVFRGADRDGDGFMSKDEVFKTVAEFYYSDDPAAPGSGLFGPV